MLSGTGVTNLGHLAFFGISEETVKASYIVVEHHARMVLFQNGDFLQAKPFTFYGYMYI